MRTSKTAMDSVRCKKLKAKLTVAEQKVGVCELAVEERTKECQKLLQDNRLLYAKCKEYERNFDPNGVGFKARCEEEDKIKFLEETIQGLAKKNAELLDQLKTFTECSCIPGYHVLCMACKTKYNKFGNTEERRLQKEFEGDEKEPARSAPITDDPDYNIRSSRPSPSHTPPQLKPYNLTPPTYE